MPIPPGRIEIGEGWRQPVELNSSHQQNIPSRLCPGPSELNWRMGENPYRSPNAKLDPPKRTIPEWLAWLRVRVAVAYLCFVFVAWTCLGGFSWYWFLRD
jgi:hypothetical protein